MQIEELDVSAKITAALAEEVGRFQKTIDNCLDDMRSKNLLNSSITLEKLTALCQQAYYERLLRAWQILFENAEQPDQTEDLSEQYLIYLENHTPQFYDDMQAIIDLAHRIADPGEPALKNLEGAISEGRFLAFRRIKPLIKDHVAGLKPQPRPAPADAAPLAAGQMLNLEAFDARDELHSTLFALEFAISGLPDAGQKQGLLPLVRTLRSAIDQTEVDLILLQDLFNQAATALKPVSGLSETYADLKQVVAGLGIELP